MLNDTVTVLTNLFRMYIIWRFAGIFLDVEQADRRKQIVGYGIFYVVNSTLFVLFHSPLVNVVVNLLGTYLLYSALYKGRYIQRLLAVGTMYGMSMSADVVFMRLMNPGAIKGTSISPLSSVTAILLSLILELLCETAIKKRHDFKLKDAMHLLSIPMISIGIIFFMLKRYAEYLDLVVVTSGGIMLINVMILYYYNQIQAQYEKEYKQQLLQRQIQEYEMQLEHMRHSSQEIRRMKHEIKHFAFSIGEEAKRSQSKAIEEMLLEMRTTVSEYEEISWSGDPILDSILNFMQEKAKQVGATINMDIKVPDKLPVKAIDMNIILGNLLENAIEAVANREDKKILLQMKYDKGTLFIQVCNSYNGLVRIKNGKYLTSKTNKEYHGIGLENIKRVVGRYDGVLKIDPSESKFNVEILIICKM